MLIVQNEIVNALNDNDVLLQILRNLILYQKHPRGEILNIKGNTNQIYFLSICVRKFTFHFVQTFFPFRIFAESYPFLLIFYDSSEILKINVFRL